MADGRRGTRAHRGDPLGALKRVALRNDADAVALRGVAMAQLGEFAGAKDLLRSAAHARFLQVRRLVLIGRLGEAESLLADFDVALLSAALRTAHGLVVAAIAMRRIRTKEARAALARAERAARRANIPALTAEVESASRILAMPAARRIAGSEDRTLLLEEVEELLASKRWW